MQMGTTAKLWLQIIQTTITGFITAGALFTVLFGQAETLKIIAAFGIVNIVVGAVSASFSTQTSAVKDVLAMPGVDKIDVNGQANKALAALAVDPTVNKIAPTSAALETVTKTAAS